MCVLSSWVGTQMVWVWLMFTPGRVPHEPKTPDCGGLVTVTNYFGGLRGDAFAPAKNY
jgi:hypothetical protein